MTQRRRPTFSQSSPFFEELSPFPTQSSPDARANQRAGSRRPAKLLRRPTFSMALEYQHLLGGMPVPHDAIAEPTVLCKAHPGSAQWPSPDAWKKLYDDTGGRLLRAIPPGTVCHPERPEYNAEKCAQVAELWSTYDFHLEDPISVMWDNGENGNCLPDPEGPCDASRYPVYVVNASETEHVKLAVDFGETNALATTVDANIGPKARGHNIRLNVKSTGHDFLGRSNAAGSLSIWVHSLNHIEYHGQGFKPKDCPRTIAEPALTVGGGTQAHDAYITANKHGRMVVGGTAKSVGITGHACAGGHSVLSSHYGLGADQILEFEMVTPGGDIIIANECLHSDLFWALRGGGASTFGVVTALTVQTYPDTHMAQIPFALQISPGPHFWEIVAYVFSQLPSLGDAGLSGHFLAINTSALGFDAGVYGSAASLSHSTTEIDKMFSTMNDTIQKRWKDEAVLLKLEYKLYDNFLDWFEEKYDKGTAGGSPLLPSRLLGNDSLHDLATLTHALEAAANDEGQIQAHLVAGQGTANVVPRGGSNAVHPAWRTAYLHIMTFYTEPLSNRTARRELAEHIKESWQPMVDLTPGGGAYINEGFKYDPNMQETFWGKNYERLLQIKRKIDPADVLWCHPCVGSESWTELHDGRLCRFSN